MNFVHIYRRLRYVPVKTNNIGVIRCYWLIRHYDTLVKVG